ncbi:lysozyme [Gallaecimonas kandeliae]|uniref:lysozyme n=1 Tax=Gallaecimonas kandeliae TaxID=3029055 RepID=UPI00264990B8|nr:lysozyme [Gallaecimonas kandeliae]WKE66211.1 lysozyme [Gallaecimonas kandeliae]
MKISASVGRSGANRPMDVKTVQNALNAWNKSSASKLKEDGLIGPLTIQRIEQFQRDQLKMHRPDGRIDPNGRTASKLAGGNANATKPSSGKHFQPSPQALALLKGIEQLALRPYDDQTGNDITAWVEGATIGYGHLIAKAEWDKFKNGITEVEAGTLFQRDLTPYSLAVNQKVTGSLTQSQFDAMVILAFNIGLDSFSKSSVLKLINDPKAVTSYPSLEAAWKSWNKSQGKVNNGLINRRNAEWKIYSQGKYERW